MNRTQRCLLFVFTIIILLSSSYSSDLDNFKYFLAATLLFFAFSPKLWFRPKHIQLEDVTTQEELESVTEHTPSIYHQLPSIGFPNSEKLLILKTLFKIRCAEIGNIYYVFRDYQKKHTDDAWIPVFMKEYAIRDTYRDFDPWANADTDTRAADRATEEHASKICEKRHYNSFFGPEKVHESKVADIKTALFFWSFGSEKMIQHLLEVKTFGLIEDTIAEIIKEYQTLEEVTEKGSFDGIFREEGSEPKIRQSLKKLIILWAGISRTLKMSILMLQDTTNNIDAELINEIEALCELEEHLDWAITETKGLGGGPNLPDSKIESFFMKRLKLNPFRERLNSHFYAIFTH